MRREHKVKLPDFKMPRKIFSEVRRQSFMTGTIINGWSDDSVNVNGSQELCVQVL
jgi:hypothetical protein